MRWLSSDGEWVVELVVGEARDWNSVARMGVDIGDLREA
jgi:hypothetical protein